MKRKLIFLMLAIPCFCMAQNNLPRIYEYDNVGNRIVRKTFELNQAPPAPQDSTVTEQLKELEELGLEQFFVEKIDQVEIKIYPNPTTEKVTLEISNMEQLQTGNFKLYSLTGQLLQEQPVSSATITVSLAGLPKGAYILKVRINDWEEDWKIIKQ